MEMSENCEEEEDIVDSIAKRIADSKIEDTHFTACWSVTTVDMETSVMMQDIIDREVMEDEGVLDTGCISTVGPKKWMNKRLKTMSKKSRDMVTVKPSGRIFRFGGGVTAKSLGLYTVPVSVAGKNTMLSVDVVEAPIPLLISKAAMKKAGAVIDTQDDTVTIFGHKEKMMTGKAGHYAIHLKDYVHDNKEVAEVLKVEEVDACETEDSENLKDVMVEILSVWAEDEEEKMK